MANNCRISILNGGLLACYFVPTWAFVAFRIVVSPIRGFYEQPNLSVALFAGDHWQLTAATTARMAWLLALGELTVVAFFALFLILITRASIRQSGGCDEALSVALALGSAISFVGMIAASQVGETAALRLHATELLMLLGAAIVLLFDRPVQAVRLPPATTAAA